MHVGTMLAHFSLLGAFFSLLAASCEFVGRFLRTLVVFFAFRVAPGWILVRPGAILEGRKPHFSMFCRARRLAMRKHCACVKTTVFPRFLYGFYTLHALCSSHKATRKRSRSLSNIASCKDCAQNASWDGFWEGLAHSEASLGRLLFALGRLLASLGCFLGVSWTLLGRSGPCLGCSVELQGRILVPQTVPGLDFRGFGYIPD